MNIFTNKKICQLILYIIISILLVLEVLNLIHFFFNINLDLTNTILTYIPEGSGTSEPQDGSKYWPTGVPQSLAILGAGLAVFNQLSRANVNPRVKVLAALGATGVTATSIFYHTALEQPEGFNRFMFGISTYAKTGHYPSLEASREWDALAIEAFVKKVVQEADTKIVDSTVKEAIVLDSSKTETFLPENYNELVNNLLDIFFKNVTAILKQVPVEGHLDDLIGQQIVIIMLLLILVLSIISLFLFYIINVIFILNKDKIINRFNNKYIKLYLKYQAFLAKISLIYAPLLILFGLFVLAHGLTFLFTHQIPYMDLGIDLHTYVSNPKLK